MQLSCHTAIAYKCQHKSTQSVKKKKEKENFKKTITRDVLIISVSFVSQTKASKEKQKKQQAIFTKGTAYWTFLSVPQKILKSNHVLAF